MNQLENCQARYRSNTWMGRTRTDGPDEFEPSMFYCIKLPKLIQNLKIPSYFLTRTTFGEQELLEGLIATASNISFKCSLTSLYKKASEYDQEIPQSHTADQPMVP